jgi:hypothetical protein
LDEHWQRRSIAVTLWHTKAGDIGASRATMLVLIQCADKVRPDAGGSAPEGEEVA